ncbi:MAG: DNA cytosine methyltransferase [Candidatus Paceibacterota bacterium]|jgi:DNA (cytosine-5)-methyltransferase 1
MAVFNNKTIHNHLVEENVKLNNNFMSPVNKKTKLQTIKKPLDLFSTQKKEAKNRGGLKMIDLFAGIGGIRQGFESIGCESVFSSEWDAPAQKTYAENFGEIPYGDITQIDPEQIPSFDILLAGFPCQPFSQAGKKLGLADTRGTLFFDIAKIVNHHRPRVVFLENVKRFKSHDGGRTFETIKTILEDLGYQVHAKVLNAKDFGVPQNRERIYIVGFLGEVDFSFPEPSGKKTRLGDILEKNVDPKYTLSDKLWAGHQRRKKEHAAKGYGFGYSMFNEESEYTSTISARYYKDGSEILIEQVGKNPRKLTPREAARLQGFPDTYKLPVSDMQVYKQFGNSVAVPVIKALAKEIDKALKTLKQKKTSDLSNIDIDKIKADSVKTVMLNLKKEATV